MKSIKIVVTEAARLMDKLAGWALMLSVFLVVANILARQIFRASILGTYEYIGYLTAAVIALSLAYCALQNGHIAVGFLVEKFPYRLQTVVEVVTGLIALVFFGTATYHMASYAHSTFLSGELSPTTMLPFYPFIYLTALGLLGLCAVILVKILEAVKKVVKGA